jgi:hypothetical protein
MPHERGPSPVPPSELLCNALADPKARFCRSLASHSSTANGNPAYSLGLKALNYNAIHSPENLRCPSQWMLAYQSTTVRHSG